MKYTVENCCLFYIRYLHTIHLWTSTHLTPMPSFVYVSNRNNVDKQLDEAFDAMVNHYFKSLLSVITVSRSWEGFQKNPFRDIVDSGSFRNSQDKKKLGRMAWNIFWLAEYALYIRYGGVTPQGVRFPGRAFEDVALREVDLATFFVRAFNAGGNLDMGATTLLSGQEL